MDAKTRVRCEARAEILKALGHPTRVFIVEQLTDGERCVCELQRDVGADMSTISKHLAILKSAGIVADDKRGNQVFYSLRLCCVQDFLSCAEKVLRGTAERQLEAAGI